MPAGSFNFLTTYNVTATDAGLGILQSTKHSPVFWGTGKAEQGKGGCPERKRLSHRGGECESPPEKGRQESPPGHLSRLVPRDVLRE